MMFTHCRTRDDTHPILTVPYITPSPMFYLISRWYFDCHIELAVETLPRCLPIGLLLYIIFNNLRNSVTIDISSCVPSYFFMISCLKASALSFAPYTSSITSPFIVVFIFLTVTIPQILLVLLKINSVHFLT